MQRSEPGVATRERKVERSSRRPFRPTVYRRQARSDVDAMFTLGDRRKPVTDAFSGWTAIRETGRSTSGRLERLAGVQRRNEQ
jgi:hypothetical protein